MKKKILLHYVMPSRLGGPNISVKRIQENKFLRESYDFFELNQNSIAGGKLNLALILRLKNEIKKIDPDIIHICGLQSAGFHCMVAAVLARCKNRIISIRGFAADDLSLPFQKKLAFKYIIEPITILLAKKVHGISEYTVNKRVVRILAKEKTFMILNMLPEYLDSYINRANIGLKESDIVILSASRLVYDKGYYYLCNVIKKIKNKKVKFIIVGEGAYERTIREKLRIEISEGKVKIIGRVNQIQDYLKISDIFVLPTLHENLGNVFIEASFCGVPIVATNVGGIPEIVENFKTGILVPSRDERSLKNALETLIYDNNLRKYLGNNGKSEIIKKLNKDILQKKYKYLYEGL